MEAIFTEKDFTLCYVPVPSGYPQSQTHAGVAIAGERLFLTTSPFPAIKYSLIRRVINKVSRILTKGVFPPIYGDAQENPMLYWGNIKEICPTVFTPYIGNPIASTPAKLFGYHAYNSDPDIFTEGNNIYILNRECYHKSTGEDYWCRIIQYHFEATQEGAQYISSKVILETPTLFLSPSITKWNGEYCMFNLDTKSYNTGDSQFHLYVRSSNNVEGSYGYSNELKVSSGAYVPWHLSLFQYKGELYSVVACIKDGTPRRLYQMLGKFDKSLTTLTIFQRPLVDVPSYRGAAYVAENGRFVLYSTTDCYQVSGSKSVDGKDVIMMAKNFESVLEIVDFKE